MLLGLLLSIIMGLIIVPLVFLAYLILSHNIEKYKYDLKIIEEKKSKNFRINLRTIKNTYDIRKFISTIKGLNNSIDEVSTIKKVPPDILVWLDFDCNIKLNELINERIVMLAEKCFYEVSGKVSQKLLKSTIADLNELRKCIREDMLNADIAKTRIEINLLELKNKRNRTTAST